MSKNKPKIIIDSAIPFLHGRLDEHAQAIYCEGNEINHEKVKDCDGLIIRTRTLCDENLLKGSDVKIIATATIGTDHIDFDWCGKNGIFVKSAPGCNAPGVAQYVFSSLFKLGFEPEKHTLGIVGFGNVGSLVGEWARQMGIRILVCDPPRQEKGLNDTEYIDLEEVLKRSDAVTLHVPLTKEGKHPTQYLIGQKELSLLKKNAVLINTSRGGVVDESKLKEELRKRRIKAVIDVWEKEPEIDRDLLSLASIGTPHIAGYSFEGKIRGTRMALEAMDEYFNFNCDKTGLYPEPSLKENQISRNLIMKSYNPEKDSEELMSSPEAFEKLRNNYSYRHEPGFEEP